MRSWSSLLARVSMAGKTPDDDERIIEFVEDVVLPGHHVVSYDPARETVLVLSAEAADHIDALAHADECELCDRIRSQLEIQRRRRIDAEIDGLS